MDRDLSPLLERLAAALERLAPPPPPPPDFSAAPFHRFDPRRQAFDPAPPWPLPLDLLLGVDEQKRLLCATLARFAGGLPANHALLWGARGAGKSSLVKSAAAAAAAERPQLRLVEVDRDDIGALPALFALLRGRPERFVVFCDDLSFAAGEAAAKTLKSALEGGVFGAPPNVLFVATSNRRHLAPERHDEAQGLIAAREDAEETVSVSDRFGLWIGFAPMDQAAFLAAVAAYADRFGLPRENLERRALQWAQRRGGRSGRAALQFARDLAGEAGIALPL